MSENDKSLATKWANGKDKPTRQPAWLMYTGLILAGLVLLAQAFEWSSLSQWTAKVGIALIFSAGALLLGRGKSSAIIAVIIVWVAVILTLVT